MHEWAMSHVFRSYVIFVNGSYHMNSYVRHMYEWVMSLLSPALFKHFPCLLCALSRFLSWCCLSLAIARSLSLSLSLSVSLSLSLSLARARFSTLVSHVLTHARAVSLSVSLPQPLPFSLDSLFSQNKTTTRAHTCQQLYSTQHWQRTNSFKLLWQVSICLNLLVSTSSIRFFVRGGTRSSDSIVSTDSPSL